MLAQIYKTFQCQKQLTFLSRGLHCIHGVMCSFHSPYSPDLVFRLMPMRKKTTLLIRHTNQKQCIYYLEMSTLTPRKYGGFKPKNFSFSKLHATSMAQNLPEIKRLPNVGAEMDKNVFKNKEPPSEIRRLGISDCCMNV